jgi:hypothetical protein
MQVNRVINKSIMLFAVWMMPWCVYKAGVQTGNSTDKGRIRSKKQVEVGVVPMCFLSEKIQASVYTIVTLNAVQM